jgi:hypothetical protein
MIIKLSQIRLCFLELHHRVEFVIHIVMRYFMSIEIQINMKRFI